MLQQDKAEDFVIATGVQYSVRQFVAFSAKELDVTLKFEGESESQILAKCKVGDVIVRVDARYYRPTEVEALLGDPSKAKAKLGWTPKITLPELVQEMAQEMMQADYAAAKRDSMIKLAWRAHHFFGGFGSVQWTRPVGHWFAHPGLRSLPLI